MGKSNPIKSVVSGLSTSIKDLGQNPEKILIGGAFSPLVNMIPAIQKENEKQKKLAVAAAEGEKKAAIADKLLAEQSVAALAEKDRKNTLFSGGGANASTLFNRSLLGTTSNSLLGSS